MSTKARRPAACLRLMLLGLGAFCLCIPRPAWGEGEQGKNMVRLSFGDKVSLVDLITYVSERTKAPFVYDETVTGDVVIRNPLEVEADSLLPILRSILAFKGYQVTEEAGWYRVRKGGGEAAVRETPREVFLSAKPPTELRPSSVYTLILEVRCLDPDEFSNAVKATVGLSATKVPGTRALVFTDYGSRIALALQMASLLDRALPPLAVESYTFGHVQAAQVKDMALALLKAQVAPDMVTGDAQVKGPALFVDQAANRMMMLLPPEKAADALKVLKALDAEGQGELRRYEVMHAGPQQACAFVRDVIKARAPGLKDVIIQPAGERTLLVIAPPVGHDVVSEALRMLDESSELTLKYYTVQHVEAARVEVLARMLLGLGGGEAATGEMLMAVPEESTLIANLSPAKHARLEEILKRFDSPHEAVKATKTQFYQVRNTDAVELAERLKAVLGVAGEEVPEQAAGGPFGEGVYLGVKRTDETMPASLLPSRGAAAPEPSKPSPPAEGAKAAKPSGLSALVRIVADKNTNTIIVQAPVEYHETIGKLVSYLDRRRPQVLIEAVLVTISTQSDLTVAVELFHKGDSGSTSALVFSAFGLSTVDLTTGKPTIKPGTGLNASIVNPEGISAIIRAIRSDTKSRVIAEPKILVNDNATGQFESIQEQPFTSVNVGTTISTTSFAGYAEAGVTIAVKPRISEGNFVVLDYAITNRDFADTSSQAGIPPARTSDVISSCITIPDGFTVVVGGLQRDRRSVSEDRVPILGKIPILGILFRSRDSSLSGSRLFVFLRPVVLRDADFTDLKDLSRADLMGSTKRAWGQDGIYPPVKPRVMK